jgi:hypothetical protein
MWRRWRCHVVRVEVMLFCDPIRPAEFVNGLAAILVGVWIGLFYWPLNPDVAYTLWHSISPTTEEIAMIAGGGIQAVLAGSPYCTRLRVLVSAVLCLVWGHLTTVYWLTDVRQLATPLLLAASLVEVWVLWRTLFDRKVNGSDRRVRRAL